MIECNFLFHGKERSLTFYTLDSALDFMRQLPKHLGKDITASLIGPGYIGSLKQSILYWNEPISPDQPYQICTACGSTDYIQINFCENCGTESYVEIHHGKFKPHIEILD